MKKFLSKQVTFLFFLLFTLVFSFGQLSNAEAAADIVFQLRGIDSHSKEDQILIGGFLINNGDEGATVTRAKVQLGAFVNNRLAWTVEFEVNQNDWVPAGDQVKVVYAFPKSPQLPPFINGMTWGAGAKLYWE